MNRKQLEECAWKKTPKDERRAQRERYDWKSKTSGIERLTGNNREVLVFDPSGDTPGTMSPWVPLWSLYSDELKQRCEHGQQPKLRAPYQRTRRNYTGDVESNGTTAKSSVHHATKKSPAQLQREIDEALSGTTKADQFDREIAPNLGKSRSQIVRAINAIVRAADGRNVYLVRERLGENAVRRVTRARTKGRGMEVYLLDSGRWLGVLPELGDKIDVR